MDATRKYILQSPETFPTMEVERMVLLSHFYNVSPYHNPFALHHFAGGY
jgi:hypothetical protein